MGSDYLFAMPSLWSGVARVMDLSGSCDSYNSSPDGKAADAEALEIDWQLVGQDMYVAIEDFEESDEAPQESEFETVST